MTDKTADSHGEKSHDISEEKDKSVNKTNDCEKELNGDNKTSDIASDSKNTSDTANIINASDTSGDTNTNTSDAASRKSDVAKGETEKEKDVTSVASDDPLFQSPINLEAKVKELLDRALVERQEREDQRRTEAKESREFSLERVSKGRFLEPIYNESGEIVGYKNPLHIGHLDLRVGQMLRLNHHPNPSKGCRYTETIAINPHDKEPKNFWGSNEELEKIKDERNLIVESGIPKRYDIDDIARNRIVVICNVKPFKSRGVDSKVVVLCAKQGDQIELLQAPTGAVPGDAIVATGYPKSPQTPYVINVTKHIGDDLRVNENKQLVYKDKPLKVENKEGFITTRTFKDCSVSNVMGYDFI